MLIPAAVLVALETYLALQVSVLVAVSVTFLLAVEAAHSDSFGD
jgi:hypothetical protein